VPFGPAEPGFGVVSASIPEDTLAVERAARGRGVGTALLTALVSRARRSTYVALSLSVEDGNRAAALYERVGFVRVGRHGTSDAMLLELR